MSIFHKKIIQYMTNWPLVIFLRYKDLLLYKRKIRTCVDYCLIGNRKITINASSH